MSAWEHINQATWKTKGTCWGDIVAAVSDIVCHLSFCRCKAARSGLATYCKLCNCGQSVLLPGTHNTRHAIPILGIKPLQTKEDVHLSVPNSQLSSGTLFKDFLLSRNS